MDTGDRLRPSAPPSNGSARPASRYGNSGKTAVFSNATISQSGATVTVHLGTPDKPQFLAAGSAGNSPWPSRPAHRPRREHARHPGDHDRERRSDNDF